MTSVTFTGHHIPDVRVVIDRQPENAPSYWPVDWFMVPEAGDFEHSLSFTSKRFSYTSWLDKHCQYRYDYVTETSGRRIFAFESDEDAVRFKMTF